MTSFCLVLGAGPLLQVVEDLAQAPPPALLLAPVLSPLWGPRAPFPFGCVLGTQVAAASLVSLVLVPCLVRW